MIETKKEYADELQRGIKGLVDDIDTNTAIGQKVIKLVHAFAYSGYLECLEKKAVRHECRSQRKSEIIAMIGSIEDGQSIDMIYGFVRRHYEERGSHGQQQGKYSNGNSNGNSKGFTGQ